MGFDCDGSLSADLKKVEIFGVADNQGKRLSTFHEITVVSLQTGATASAVCRSRLRSILLEALSLSGGGEIELSLCRDRAVSSTLFLLDIYMHAMAIDDQDRISALAIALLLIV